MRFEHDFARNNRASLDGKRCTRNTAPLCIVVAADEGRCEVLCEAAESAGWIPILCDDVPSAVVNYKRTLVSLVIVDLDAPPGRPSVGFRKLLEWFAAQRHPLVVICGHEGDAQEEIWARQLGPWLYLTGNISASALAVHLKVARGQAPEVLAELPD
jgi:DNA-binding response OmpR family regulator